jgi:hypothetical protein
MGRDLAAELNLFLLRARRPMMSNRIVFEFLRDVSSSAEEWRRVKAVLTQGGAMHVSEPTGGAPHVISAVLPDHASAKAIVSRLRAMDGVGRADVDEYRDIL